MTESDVVENWLSTLSYSHSGSKQTEKQYRIQFAKFLDFTSKKPEEIIKEYENCNKDRQFKRKYARILMSLIRHLQNLGYAPSSVSSAINVVKSFFKYKPALEHAYKEQMFRIEMNYLPPNTLNIFQAQGRPKRLIDLRHA